MNVIAISIVAILGWGTLFVFVPKMLRDISRHKLWELRDELANQILRGEIDKSEAALRLLRRIEIIIAFASKLSLIWMIFIPPTPPEVLKDIQETCAAELDAIDPSQRKILEDIHERLHHQIAVHLLASPSGWMVVLAAIPIAVLLMLKEGWNNARKWIEEQMELATAARLETAATRKNSAWSLALYAG